MPSAEPRAAGRRPSRRRPSRAAAKPRRGQGEAAASQAERKAKTTTGTPQAAAPETGEVETMAGRAEPGSAQRAAPHRAGRQADQAGRAGSRIETIDGDPQGSRRPADAAARSPDRAAQPADVLLRRDLPRLPGLLFLRRGHLRVPGAAAGRHLSGADRPADDLHRARRGVLHLCEGRVLGRRVPDLPVRRDPALAVHRARSLSQREAGVPAVPGGDPGPVLPRRRDGLLLHLPARLALLPELRDQRRRRRRCRSSWRRGSASTCRW